MSTSLSDPTGRAREIAVALFELQEKWFARKLSTREFLDGTAPLWNEAGDLALVHVVTTELKALGGVA